MGSDEQRGFPLCSGGKALLCKTRFLGCNRCEGMERRESEIRTKSFEVVWDAQGIKKPSEVVSPCSSNRGEGSPNYPVLARQTSHLSHEGATVKAVAAP